MLRPLAAAAITGAALLGITATPAAAYVPAPTTTFNTPASAGGSEAEQQTFLRDVIAAITAAPAKATITISMYSLSDPAVVDAIIDAHQRKVIVRFLTWDAEPDNVQFARLRKALGTNTKTPSWFKMCRGSCARSGDVGAQHSKIVAISSIINPAGEKVSRITLVSSGNLTLGGARTQWNAHQTIVSPRFYSGARDYILAIAGDKDRYDFPAVTSEDGKYRMSFFPRKTQAIDPVADSLRVLDCRRGDRVWFAMYLWSDRRLAMAKEAVSLKRRGCDVLVLMDSPMYDDSIEAVLRKGKVDLRDSNVGGMSSHMKVTVVDAHRGAKRVRYVWTGSPNFSYAARYLNAEALLRINSASETALHFRQISRILDATNGAKA